MGYEGLRIHNEPDKCTECEMCVSTRSLRDIIRAAQACNPVTRLNHMWVVRECERGLGIKNTSPKKYG